MEEIRGGDEEPEAMESGGEVFTVFVRARDGRWLVDGDGWGGLMNVNANGTWTGAGCFSTRSRMMGFTSVGMRCYGTNQRSKINGFARQLTSSSTFLTRPSR
jgi:hypothetical protein